MLSKKLSRLVYTKHNELALGQNTKQQIERIEINGFILNLLRRFNDFKNPFALKGNPIFFELKFLKNVTKTYSTNDPTQLSYDFYSNLLDLKKT